MYNQLFGNYLVEEGILTEDELDEILKQQQNERLKLGTIAVAEGYMSSEQVEEVNHLQIQKDMRFGDIAIEEGYLDADQVVELLSQQGNAYLKFVQILMDELGLELNEIAEYAEEFQNEYGFSDEEIKALREDDFDNIVPAFVYASKPYVTELVALVLRNMVRFASADFYIGNVKHVNELSYKSIAGQRLIGEHNIVLGFVGEEDDEGMMALASDFTDMTPEELGDEMYDAIGEFANICNGFLATDLAHRKVRIDMEPPFVYLNQKVEGSGYLIPLFLHGKEIKIFISVDSDTSVGTEQFVYEIETEEDTVGAEEGAKTVVLVDDSIFIRKTLRSMVEEFGYTVVAEAVNGVEGVEAYKKYKPSVVTLDITMPVMDGIEALKQIMEYDDKAKVMMVTAAGQQTKVIESLKLGAQKFVMKPFDKEEIKKTMSELA